MRKIFALSLVAVLFAATPSTAQRQTAMHAILAFAVRAAQAQLRGPVTLPHGIAREIFDYCQVAPREKYEAVFGGRPVFECDDSFLEIFASRADFANGVRRASPVAFTHAVPCPKPYFDQVFFSCARSAEGVQIDLAEDAQDTRFGPGQRSFSLFVLAPPLSPSVRARLLREGTRMLRPLLADMARFAVKPFGDAEAAQFAAQHSALLHHCVVDRPPTGRPVLGCNLAVLQNLATADLVAAGRRALPLGFHRAPCVERNFYYYYGLSPICERNAASVEIRFGAGLRIEADDTAYPSHPASALRSFFTLATAAVANKLRSFNRNEELPYFGRICSSAGTAARPALICSPSVEAREFDLLAIVRRALPPGYAASECTGNVWGFLNPSLAVEGCFSFDGRPDIDVAEYQGGWHVYVGYPPE